MYGVIGWNAYMVGNLFHAIFLSPMDRRIVPLLMVGIADVAHQESIQHSQQVDCCRACSRGDIGDCRFHDRILAFLSQDAWLLLCFHDRHVCSNRIDLGIS